MPFGEQPAPNRLVGPYQLLKSLGQGGMGVVYHARHQKSGQEVALKTVKVPNEDRLRSLRREIHALAHLRHSGIVRILDQGVSEGVPFYAMEFLEGQTLKQWHTSLNTSLYEPTQGQNTLSELGSSWWTQSLDPPLSSSHASKPKVPFVLEKDSPLREDSTSWLAVLSLVGKLCEPLAYLHGEGIVHRDLKPENILTREQAKANIIVLDFADRNYLASKRAKIFEKYRFSRQSQGGERKLVLF